MKSKYILAAALALALALVACGRDEQEPRAADVRTVENSPMEAIPIDQQPTISENAPAPTTTSTAPGQKTATAAQTTTMSSDQELEQKMELPFSPPLAMDPVDGSKVSISASTPMIEYKKKLYYFSSDQNKRAFAANPEVYIHGQLAKY